MTFARLLSVVVIGGAGMWAACDKAPSVAERNETLTLQSVEALLSFHGPQPTPERNAQVAQAKKAGVLPPGFEHRVMPVVPLGIASTIAADSSGKWRATFPAYVRDVSPAYVALAERADGRFEIASEDVGGVRISVRPVGAAAAPAEVSRGFVVYRNALGRSAAGRGFDILHRLTPDGTEDYVHLPDASRASLLEYDVHLDAGVAGLRLVANTLELLDADGAPRLRVASPYGYDAEGNRFAATLEVAGCRYDSNPAGPWGRAVTAPGAEACTVRVRWDGASLAYPAFIDPQWTKTGNMVHARGRMCAQLIPGNKILTAGGTDTGSPFDASFRRYAEIYDIASGTWATTQDTIELHQYGICSALPSGNVFMAGTSDSFFGNSAGVKVKTELYDPTAGTWSYGPDLNWSRTRNRSVTLKNGKVWIVGGGTKDPTQVSQFLSDTTELYDPTSNTIALGPKLAAPSGNGAVEGLPNGDVVFFMGGSNDPVNMPNTTPPVTQIYVAAMNTVRSLAGPATAGGNFEANVSGVMTDGRVIIAGGGQNNNCNQFNYTNVYNPATDSFTATASNPAAGGLPGAVISNGGCPVSSLAGAEAYGTETNDGLIIGLPNGDGFLLAGNGSSKKAWIWDHQTGNWSASAEVMNSPHDGGNLLPLPDGRIVAFGGFDSMGNGVNVTEIYGCSSNADCLSGRFAVGATKPLCNLTAGPSFGLCQPCNGDNGSGATLQCPGAGQPICQTTGPLAGSCTQCAPGKTGLCSGATALCDPSTGSCGGCDGDFGALTARPCPTAGLPACETTGANAGKCVQCDASNKTQCTGATAFCDLTTDTCAGCNGNNGSAATRACPTTATPACVAGTCKQCSSTSTTACTGTSPVCNIGTSTCGPCDGDFGAATTSACPSSSSPFCKADGSCGKCTDNGTGATGCTNNTPIHAGNICNATSGACSTTCVKDADCSATAFCDAMKGMCTPKISNGLPVPTVPGRAVGDPPLTGTCTSAAGAAACSSGVCSMADNLCGLPNTFSCTAAKQCRANVCNADGKCGDPNSTPCTVPTAPGGIILACRSDICFQGSAINPSDLLCGVPNKDTCAAPAECRSAICVSADGRCGLLNGSPGSMSTDCRSGVLFSDGRCGLPNGQPCSTPDVCRSAICSGSGTCGPTCAIDNDCPSIDFCDAATGACVPDYPNSGPQDPAKCDRAAQCQSGVCHSDGKCGLPDGTPLPSGNTCTPTAAAACRSGSCDTATNACGGTCGADSVVGDAKCATVDYCDGTTCRPDKPNRDDTMPVGDTSCNRAGQCASGICFGDGQCGVPEGKPCGTGAECRGALSCTAGICVKTGCTDDVQCGTGLYCESPGASGSCKPQKPNSQPCARPGVCVSHVCNADGKCGNPKGDPCGSDLICRSNVCDPKTGVCSGCVRDSDCGTDTSGMVCDDKSGDCGPGCRGTGGNGCPAPQLCTSKDTSIGVCVSCLVDADCGGAYSGRICSDMHMCVDGCRGTAGNSCPPSAVCSSKDAAAGTCNPIRTFAGGGLGCELSPRGTPHGLGWLVLGLLVLGLSRRRWAARR